MLTLRVLGYQEKSELWAAHCLETDLVGYGKTFKKAFADLEELTEMQFSFAIQKKQPALLDRPASADIHDIYNRLLRQTLESFPSKKEIDPKRRISSIPVNRTTKRGAYSVVSSQAI